MVNIKMDGKVGIVTGGASGLGKSTALRFAEAGADVAVADINMENTLKTVEKIKNMVAKQLRSRLTLVIQKPLSNLLILQQRT